MARPGRSHQHPSTCVWGHLTDIVCQWHNNSMTNDSQWVTIPEASALLSKSERTIYRWVSANRLTVRDTPEGKLVDVSDEITLPGARPSDVSDSDTQTAEMAKLQSDNDRLSDRVSQMTDERDYLRQQVDRLEGLLESQNVIIQTMQMTKQKALPDPARRRSWWKRFSGWIDPTADVDEAQGE